MWRPLTNVLFWGTYFYLYEFLLYDCQILILASAPQTPGVLGNFSGIFMSRLHCCEQTATEGPAVLPIAGTPSIS